MSAEQPFFRVNNYELFGEVVDEWVRKPGTRPLNWDRFIEILNDRGIGPIVPDDFGKPELVFHELIDGKMNITLPTKKMLDDANTAIDLQKKEYVFPSQYDLAYKGPLDPDIDNPKRKKVQKARLADYCIDLCM
ncbi:hypothetical protein [Roseibium marinum]|uniref:Uncharacterized protein n=1 Tax=Roseibium marinum TaxID=281252 RepID=A0A2S3UK26_9HYPH|nr:hypothetical protein [Roseibium marinum]POF27930.1 hypothetical protein CLV41_11911 [Roseibium marinum]